MDLDFTNIARGTNSGYRTGSRLVIENRREWETLWREHVSGREPSPPVPPVDFSDEVVIAVFAGEKRTGGHSVEITGVETRPQRANERPVLVVKLRQRSPGAGAITQDVITQPHHIVRVPKTDYSRVVFETAP